MIIVGISKEHRCFDGLYYQLFQKIRSTKAVVLLYSIIGGVLPIPGRIITTATLLRTLPVKNRSSRSALGVVGYLSTHHYYFWSPLEATVIIPIAMLSLSYKELLLITWPLLAVYLAVTCWCVVALDVETLEAPQLNRTYRARHSLPLILGIASIVAGLPPYYGLSGAALYYIWLTKSFSIKQLAGYIQWRLVAWLLVISILSIFIKRNLSEVDRFTTDSVYYAAFIGAVASFLMGSSAKFAGIASGLTLIYGMEYFLLFFGTEFVGYLLSPSHRCVWITKDMFDMKWREFYLPLGALSVILLIISIVI